VLIRKFKIKWWDGMQFWYLFVKFDNHGMQL
jgi:hypothetical protein